MRISKMLIKTFITVTVSNIGNRAFAWLAKATFACCITCLPCKGQVVLPLQSSWEYYHPLDATDPADTDIDFETTWHSPSVYDGPSFSASAPALFGYGEIQGATIVTDISTPAIGSRYTAYFRTTFTTTSENELLEVKILADDGGVLYIDGVATAFVNYTGEDRYFGLAESQRAGSLETELFSVPIGALEPGEHVVAFSLHNRNPNSSDLGFDLQIQEMRSSDALKYLNWTSSNGTVSITGSAEGASGVLDIPDTIGGLPVTSISDDAFLVSQWVSVSIPDSVTSIGNAAFRLCPNLTNVTLPEGLISIDSFAFEASGKLDNIVIPQGVTSIGSFSFRDCSSLTSIVIPESITSIENRTFKGCSSLASVIIPESVTRIEDAAFWQCSSLEHVVIPQGVTSIETSTFSSCSSLTSIAIPDSVTSIGDFAFAGCTALTNLPLPDSITSVGDWAFCCGSLESINFPESITTIGEGALSTCINLTHVTIPNRVTSIKLRLFDFCTGLISVTLPGGVTDINFAAFRNCSSLTTINIPGSVTSIGNSAFQGCSSLTRIVLPENILSIGDAAFQDSESLGAITFLGTPPELGGANTFSNIDPEAQALVAPARIAAFGGENALWNQLVVRPILLGAAIVIRSTGVFDSSFKIEFAGDTAVTDWRIMGSSSLQSFDEDLSEASNISEITPGIYEANVPMAGKTSPFFFRIER